MPKIVHAYPDEERLEVLVLANSPCTPSELLRMENIPVKPNTLETIKKKLDFLSNNGKVMTKKVAKGNVYWHSSIEVFKKNTLSTATEKLVQTDVSPVSS
jgi:hypothetical protein